MRYLILVPLLLCSPALAQSLVDDGPGQYGSATDSANSCGTNPHELGFQTSPPHVILTWSQPKDDGVGQPRTIERYDIEDYDTTTLTLREEGDFRPDRDGGRMWVMQMTQSPDGYCWRRPDWPQVRCEDQQLRCEKPIS
ncbi:MAG: hypothetical protein H7317_00895 [Pseudorhodobacter sp.]|nr:hypothetical protein [Pseudorhodobacter sp.]